MLAPLDFQGGIIVTKTAEISVVFDFVKKQILCYANKERVARILSFASFC